MRLPAPEFIRRFIMHLVPKRLRVIRAMGLYSKRQKRSDLLNPVLDKSILHALFGSEPEYCPNCKIPMAFHCNLTKKALLRFKSPPEAVAA